MFAEKKAIRVIARLKRIESCVKAYKYSEIITFPSLYIYETIIYDWLKCKAVCNRDVHNYYNTRGAVLLLYKPHKQNVYRKLLSQAGVVLINTLPDSIRQKEHIHKFINRLRQPVLSKPFYLADGFLNGVYQTFFFLSLA